MARPLETRACKGCGKPIAFVKNEAGKTVPLDVRAPVYKLKEDFTGAQVASLVENFYTSHFATCPKANDFSASRKS